MSGGSTANGERDGLLRGRDETNLEAGEGHSDSLAISNLDASAISNMAVQIMKLVKSEVGEAFLDYEEEGTGDEPPEVPGSLTESVIKLGGDAAVYACLCAMERFAALSSTQSADVLHLDHDALMWSRARYCELLAITVLESLVETNGTEYVITHVLAAVFPNHNAGAEDEASTGLASSVRRRFGRIGEDTSPESAIEQGLECNARNFVEHKVVNLAVEAIWDGTLTFAEDQTDDPNVLVPTHKPEPTHGDIGISALVKGHGRLRVPENQVFVAQLAFVVLLALYTYVVNNRHVHPTVWEYIFLVFGIGYTLSEIGQVWQLGIGLYLKDSWNLIDILLWTTFTAAASIRIYIILFFLYPAVPPTSPVEPPPPGALMTQTAELDTLGMDLLRKGGRRGEWVDRYYDILSLMAVPLWLRILSAFNEIQYIATTIIVIQRLLKDSLMFLLLLIPICIGFSQALLGLDPKHEALDGVGFFGVFFFLMRGFIGDLDFDGAGEFDSFYGPLFYGIFILLGYIILLNLLIAIYCSSFEGVLESSTFQFRSQRIIATLQLSDRYESHPFSVPFNFFEILLVYPARFLAKLSTGFSKPVSKTGAVAKWTAMIWWICCLPLHTVVALVEEGKFVWYRLLTRTARKTASLDWEETVTGGEELAGGGGRKEEGKDGEEASEFGKFVASLLESKVSLISRRADLERYLQLTLNVFCRR